jgi:hypothetical protein
MALSISLRPVFFPASRQLGDGVQVANAGEVGVLLPVLERPADAGCCLASSAGVPS